MGGRGASTIDAPALLAKIESGEAPRILDVRSRAEFARGHLPGAVHVPFWELHGRLASLSWPRQEPVVVYCGHGPRAWMAGGVLRRSGFTQVTYLAGHFSRWRRAGFREER